MENKHITLNRILDITLIVLIGLIALNYVVNFNPKNYLDEIMSMMYVLFMMGLRIFLYYMVVKPIEQLYILTNCIVKNEEFTQEIYINNNAEIGKISHTVLNIAEDIKQVQKVVYALERGDYNEVIPAEQQARNPLVRSLAVTQNRLYENIEQEKLQKWATIGLTRFIELLRNDYENVKTLADSLLSQFVEYMEANQGGFFVLNGDNYAGFYDDNTIADERNENIYLELVASYAFHRKKFVTKRVELDEGLIGRVFQEKHLLYLDEIPADYLHFTSGLGDAPPKYLLILPLKLQQKIEGVIEIASFSPIPLYKIEFAERVCEIIVNTIISNKNNQRIKTTLQTARQKEENLKNQEKELMQQVKSFFGENDKLKQEILELKQQLERYRLDSFV